MVHSHQPQIRYQLNVCLLMGGLGYIYGLQCWFFSKQRYIFIKTAETDIMLKHVFLPKSWHNKYIENTKHQTKTYMIKIMWSLIKLLN